MNTEDKNLAETGAVATENSPTTPGATDSTIEPTDILQDNIIRNDTIPETKDTPGSNGAYPVGAFENRKD